MGHVGVGLGWGVSWRGGVGHVGVGVGHAGVGCVMQGWGGSCRGRGW